MTAIAIDVGTSMIKAVAFDDSGAELTRCRQATEVYRPRPGWAEQDMRAVWNAVVFTVRSVLAEVQEPVQFLTITAQGDGCWLVDDAGRPTGPAILWSDGRAAGIVAQWRSEGRLEEAFRINGSLTFAGLPNAIIAWLAEHDPERLARSRTALYCGGWLHLMMTGRAVVDESDASAPFLDLGTRAYSEEVQKIFGGNLFADLLPTVVTDEHRVAGLGAHAAAALDLPLDLPVVLAPYDVVSTAIGSGAVAPGQACSILGTTLCTEVVRSVVDVEGEPSGLTLGTVDGAVVRAFPTLAGTEVLTWTSRLLGVEGPAQLSSLAAQAPPGAGGAMLLPYLSPSGERAPFLDPAARGTFWGLSFEHGRAEIARAVFEGLSLAIADCLDAAGGDVTDLRCCGGGAVNDAWCALISDVVGSPTIRTGDAEVGAKGAFLVGLVATGAEADLPAAAAAYVHERPGCDPDPARVELYRELRATFRELREIARPGWHRQAETVDSTGRIA